MRVLGQLALHDIDAAVVERLALEPSLGACRTLDALHIATALCVRERVGDRLVLLTLDQAQARAARACGLPVPLGA